MILTIRTDKPEAELGLYKTDGVEVSYLVWHAHRELSETIHNKIQIILCEGGINLKDLTGFVFYEGPGSFTGLRIGAAVANAMASSLGQPVVSTGSVHWINSGITRLGSAEGSKAVPHYDSAPKTTIQKK